MADLFDNAYFNFWQNLKKGKSENCPCCGRYAKIYRRQLHYSVAMQLIEIYKLGGDKDFVNLNQLIRRWPTGIGDFTKAKYWQLVEPKPHEPAEKKSIGLWRLTEFGIEFILGKKYIQKYAVVFDDEVKEFSGVYMNISDCLGVKFNYEELMAA